MKKSLFSAFAVGLCMTASVMAQVPSYVPTNGLVGWWPFNGNANDESGNGNNGTVNGATLTTDRFGNSNKAYGFYGNSDYIEISTTNGQFNNQQYSLSFWLQTSSQPSSVTGGPNVNPAIISRLTSTNSYDNFVAFEIGGGINYNSGSSAQVAAGYIVDTNLYNDSWFNITYSVSNDSCRTYLNGIKIYSQVINGSVVFLNAPIRFGRSQNTYWKDYSGNLDNIGYWNRALSEQEIYVLYSGCTGNEITSQPVNSINNIGSNALLSVNSVSGSTYLWQSNPSNFGWQNVPNNSNYSGGNTNTLTVNNVQLSNHNQPFRVIVNASGCIDTSNVATIHIADTCITTIYDTLYTTVTDTLIINTTLSLPAPNNENTIFIYPNPASDHITIDNGNYTAMAGYTIKIENNAGQQVFQSTINQAQFYVDLSTWTGNGLYFVHLIDPQNNTVTVRKIVLQ